MGELVFFKPKADLGRKVNPAGASAEILFFMGVRIARVEEVEAPPKLRRRRPGARSDAPRKRRTAQAESV